MSLPITERQASEMSGTDLFYTVVRDSEGEYGDPYYVRLASLAAYLGYADTPGDVIGPDSSTDNAMARFNGATGNYIQNSVVIVGDAGEVSGVKTLAMDEYIDFTEIAAPANPAADVGRMYSKDNGGVTTPYWRDSAGTETQMLGAGATGVTASAVIADHTMVRGDGGARGVQDTGITISDTDVLVSPGSATFDDLYLYDTDASHTLLFHWSEDEAGANRTLNWVVGGADRTITLSGDPTLGDWFDQAVKQASNVTFGTIGSNEITIADGHGLNLQEDITFTGATTENLIEIPDNLAVALEIREGANAYMTFITSDTGRVVQIPQDVVVGITVRATDADLEVNSTGDARIALRRFDTSLPDNTAIGSIDWWGDDPEPSHLTARILVRTAETWETNEYGSDMEFYTTPVDAAAPVLAMTIAAGGDVGIGAVPDADHRLVVSDTGTGVIRAITTDATDAGAIVEIVTLSGSPANNDYAGRIDFRGYSVAAGPVYTEQLYGDMRCRMIDVTDGSEDAQIRWHLMSGGAFLERAVLDHNGNLQIDGKLTATGCPETLEEDWKDILAVETAKEDAPRDDRGAVVKPEGFDDDKQIYDDFIDAYYHNTGVMGMASAYGLLAHEAKIEALETEVDRLRELVEVN